MKKKKLILIGLLAAMMTAAGCGQTNVTDDSSSKEAFAPSVIIPDESESSSSSKSSSASSAESESASSSETIDEVAPDGMYRSELTNEWISDTLQNQRPIAVMIDNESSALPHYGINQADIVYEMMNSTKNGRITRLMAIVKDWKNVTKLGSIRSARPTNFMLIPEYDAILCHDGGPWYIDYYVSLDYTNNLSGGFARDSKRSAPYNEYVTYDSYTNGNGQTYSGLGARIKEKNYSTTYTENYPGKHFKFSNNEFMLSDSNYGTKSATDIDLPFPHNESELKYNKDTKTYDYYVYGSAHIDALTDEITSFKNVILQSCDYVVFDDGGYMKYYVNTNSVKEETDHDRTIFGNISGFGCYSDASDGTGYYITNGEAIRITWTKGEDTDITIFKNAQTGEVITMNTGNTYIGIVPSDYWDQLVIK